jgi:hypothetical protein
MDQDNAHHDPPDKEGARWAGRDDCGLPEHPDLSWAAQRSSSVPGPRWDLPRTYGPMLPGAVVQTANGALSRVEQTRRFAILPVSWEPGGDQVTPTINSSARPSRPYTPNVIESLYAGACEAAQAGGADPGGHASPQEPRQNCPPPAAAYTQRANQLA